MLKIHRNVRTVGTVHRNVGTDQFLGFPWLFNTYLPYRERSRRSLDVDILAVLDFEIPCSRPKTPGHPRRSGEDVDVLRSPALYMIQIERTRKL